MRTAEDTISQAIAENPLPEYLLYGFAAVFVVTGEILIWWSIQHGSGLGALGGAALNGFVWPAFRQTRELRQQNLMLRMLEIPLSKAKTADEAANMLTEAFSNHFNQGELRKPKAVKQGAE